MKAIEPEYTSIKRDLLLPVRAMLIGFPITVVSATFLWVTDYPLEEWPFIGGVLTICLLASFTIVKYATLFAVKRLVRYGRRVMEERGIDPEIPAIPESREPERTLGSVLFVLAVILLQLSATLGISLVTLTLVMARMQLAPFGDYFGAVAYALLGFGMGGLVLVFGTAAGNLLSSQR